jgi:hypothetical protein
MKNESKDPIVKQSIPENAELINYLDNKLLSGEKRRLEELISDDPFIGDGIEGLQYINSTASISEINSSLNRLIDQKLSKKKKRLMKPIGFPMWMTLLVTITLLAVLAGYVLIKLLNR